MIIKSIEIENIRSYSKSIIEFENGINFLSGDIGTGKSTILQAIEFSLFGFKRGDLEGIHLLRKGEKTGSVKIIFEDENQREVEIFRRIKQSKTGAITQENGYVKLGNNLTELSPQEINSQVFDIFNFPQSFISKDRTLIYRFTIYTPQEQLKEVLFADVEKRLEIIRKIFDIDKYKQLKDAISIYSNNLREEKQVNQIKLEPKKQIENELNKNNLEILNLENELDKIKINEKLNLDKKEKVQNNLKKREEIIEKISSNSTKYEKAISTIDEIKNMVEKFKINIKKREKYILKFNIKEIEKQIQKSEIEKSEIGKNILNLNNEKDKFEIIENKLKKLKEKIKKSDKLKQKITILENDIKNRDKSFDYMLTKCIRKDLENEILKLKSSFKKLEKVKKEIEIKEEEILKNKIIIENKKNKIKELNSLIKNIENIDICSTCMQEVDCSHKDKIITQNKKEILIIERELEKLIIFDTTENLLLNELKDKMNEANKINETIIEKNQKIELFLEKEKSEEKLYETLKEDKNLLKTLENNLSLEKIEENEKKIVEIELKLKNKNKINNELIELNLNISKLNLLIQELKSKINTQETKKTEIEKIEIEIETSNLKISKELGYKEKLNELKEKSKQIKIDINKLKENLNQIILNEKEISNIKTKNNTNLENIKIQLNKDEKLLKNLIEIEKKYINQIYLSDLLNNKLTLIAQKIETQIFTKYYIEFNEEFEKLFKELIEDNEIEVRLDENFSPIIEQNGYDIDIKNLSGGEKSSLALSYRLGLKKIIENNIKSNSNLSLLILDEPTDGFSENQISRLGNILKNTNLKQIILVSHDDKIESIADKILYVDKINHESKIV